MAFLYGMMMHLALTVVKHGFAETCGCGLLVRQGKRTIVKMVLHPRNVIGGKFRSLLKKKNLYLTSKRQCQVRNDNEMRSR
jgi:hypothetical protein